MRRPTASRRVAQSIGGTFRLKPKRTRCKCGYYGRNNLGLVKQVGSIYALSISSHIEHSPRACRVNRLVARVASRRVRVRYRSTSRKIDPEACHVAGSRLASFSRVSLCRVAFWRVVPQWRYSVCARAAHVRVPPTPTTLCSVDR